MTKSNIPLFNIQQHCKDTGIHDFKVGSIKDQACTAVEFEENHRHEYYEIIWLMNGKGSHQIDLQNYAYEGSVIFMLTPGQVHKIDQKILSDGYVIKFLPSVFAHEQDFSKYILDTRLFNGSASSPVIQVPENIQENLESLFLSLLEELRQVENDSEVILSSYLKILITHLSRVNRKEIVEGTNIHNSHYELFKKFKLKIEGNYKRQHAVQYYADALNTQPRTLNTVSREFADKSAGELIHDRVLLEARRSLQYESKSVKEIGFELGFNDPAYFTRFFRRRTGRSPQSFKERHAELAYI